MTNKNTFTAFLGFGFACFSVLGIEHFFYLHTTRLHPQLDLSIIYEQEDSQGTLYHHSLQFWPNPIQALYPKR